MTIINLFKIMPMENFLFSDSFSTLSISVVFYLSALLSFACGASAILSGIVYRTESLIKSAIAILVGIAVVYGVSWGMDELHWTVPTQFSFAALAVVGPSWLFFGGCAIFLAILDILRKFSKNR